MEFSAEPGDGAAAILEQLPAVVLVVDAAGSSLMANAAARRLPRPAESRDIDIAVLEAGKPDAGRLERWVDPDGELLWMRTDRLPFEADGERRLLVVAHDATAAVEREQALALANEDLNQFAYIASHDLQEPLRKIGTFVDILLEGLETGNADDVAYSTRVIKDSARRASALIRDLLAWSRLTNRALDRKPLPFARFVRDVVADVVAARPQEAVEVVDEMADLVVQADATHLRQLIENLVVNAVKYRHPDRPARIVLRLQRTDRRHAVFEIEDNGIGFDPGFARQIFEPFRRLHNDRDYKGTGVGLAICSRVCEHHGWTIAADGRPGEGATFRVNLALGGETGDGDQAPAKDRTAKGDG